MDYMDLVAYKNNNCVYIDQDECVKVIFLLRKVFFLKYFENVSNEKEYINNIIEEVKSIMEKEIAKSYLLDSADCKDKDICEKATLYAKDQTDKFIKGLKEVRDLLVGDVNAIYTSDPASYNIGEIILTYPGLFAILVYRISHVLYELKVNYIPRILSEYAHGKTGIDINPGAKIGKNFFIDHGTGIVIGETSVIGNNVKLYQGVTIGALSIKDAESLRNKKRHPNIGDNVTIYSGASILGGNTVIGDNCVIGSNAFITESVNDNMLVKSTKTKEDRYVKQK